MRVALLAVAVLLSVMLCSDKVFGAPQTSLFTTTYGDNKVTFAIVIYIEDDEVNATVVADPTTGLESTGTSADACRFTTADGSLESALSVGRPVRKLSLVIDYSTPTSPVFMDTSGTVLGCVFQYVDAVEAAAGKFTFYLRGLSSVTETNVADREYIFVATGSGVSNSLVPGSTTFAGPPSMTLNAVTPTTYTFNMAVVDAISNVAQTTMNLGASAKLKFTFTADPYIELMDLGGARLTNCIVDKVATFDSPAITIIGLDGCFKEVEIFTNMFTNVGFRRHAASSTLSSTTKTFVAYSPTLEMSAFMKSPVDEPNALYFMCDVEFCLDDSDTSTAGQCGASHCSTSRRKRDTGQRPDTSVMASVNITTHQDPQESCQNCTDTTTFQASLGGLATIAAILLGVMTFSFTSARSAAIGRLQRRKKAGLDHSYVSRFGTVYPKAATGSDIISRGSSIPRTSRA